MDLSKLALLSTEALQQMQEAIKGVLAARLDTTPRPGRRATFEYQGVVRTVTIDRVNPKTVSCTETGGSVSPGKRWKVGHSFLKVEPIERKVQAPPPINLRPYKPASVGSGDAW